MSSSSGACRGQFERDPVTNSEAKKGTKSHVELNILNVLRQILDEFGHKLHNMACSRILERRIALKVDLQSSNLTDGLLVACRELRML